MGEDGAAGRIRYIYVTTQDLTRAHFKALSDEVGPKRFLLVICYSFSGCSGDEFTNLTIRTLRKELIGKYEYGVDSYAMKIAELADESDDDEIADEGDDKPDDSVKPEKAAVKRKPGRPPKDKSGKQTIPGVKP